MTQEERTTKPQTLSPNTFSARPNQDAPMPIWWATGASTRGAAHVRGGLPNQDAISWRKCQETILIALADGHGSPRYVRSHQGAKLAVQMTVDELERFYLAHQDPAALKRLAEEQLPRTLVRCWQDLVAEKLAQSPLTESETSALARHLADANLESLQERPQRIFGATLLAGIIAPTFALYLQLGDGDIVTVDAQGIPARLPLAPDERLVANQTTSLAGPQAWQDMRVYFQPFVQEPPALILFATDGYANSYQDEAGFLTAAADFHAMLHDHNPGYVRRHLRSWLTQTSELGSGDDITVGIVAHLPPLLAAK